MSAKCNGTWTHHAAGKHTGAFTGAPQQSRCTEQRLSHAEETRMGVHRTMRVCWVEIMILSSFRNTWHKQARASDRFQPGCGGHCGTCAVIMAWKQDNRFALFFLNIFLKTITFHFCLHKSCFVLWSCGVGTVSSTLSNNKADAQTNQVGVVSLFQS